MSALVAIVYATNVNITDILVFMLIWEENKKRNNGKRRGFGFLNRDLQEEFILFKKKGSSLPGWHQVRF